MPVYYFGLNTSPTTPAIGSLSTTTKLNDGSVGDTSTWPTPNLVNSVQSSPLYTATVYGFAIFDPGLSITLITTQFTWKVVIGNDFGNLGGKSATAVLEYSADTTNGTDGSWTAIGTNTIGLVNAGGGTYGPQTYNPSVTGINCRMVRIRYTVTTVSGSNPTFAEVDASDFRLIYYINMASTLDITTSFWMQPLTQNVEATSSVNVAGTIGTVTSCGYLDKDHCMGDTYTGQGCAGTTYTADAPETTTYTAPAKVTTSWN